MIVLLVEDQSSMRRVVASMLAKMGFTDVVQAADGEEALEVLRMRHVELVLTDWVMPNLDGGALLRQIRDTPIYEDLPVVVFSALSEPENVRAVKNAGSDAFLPKPFSREQLQKKNRRGPCASYDASDPADHSAG